MSADISHSISFGDQIISEQFPDCLSSPFTFSVSFRLDRSSDLLSGTISEIGAPISEIVPLNKSEDLSNLKLTLNVNGELKQSGNCSEMIWSPKEILCEMSADIPLSQGDLIFTGL